MKRNAFTLIELVMVMAIMAILAAMVMPMLGIARRSAQKANAEAMMHKIDAACRMFRRDVGAFPYQATYPAQVTTTTPFANNLARRLCHRMSDAELTALRTLTSVATGKYAYPANLGNGSEPASYASNLTFRISYLPSQSAMPLSGSNISWASATTAAALNRMGSDRARIATLAGGFDLSGGIISGPNSSGVITKDLSNERLLSSAEIGSVAGWCDDYLQGEIEARFLQGDAIVDTYGSPLVYICQVIPRVRMTETRIGGQNIPCFESIWFGLGSTGFSAKTGPWDSLVAARRFYLTGLGRVRLSRSDAGDGKPPPVDATYLPDAANLLRSDRRYYASEQAQLDFELWSPGQDRSLGWMRQDMANTDNVAGGPYDRGL